MEYDSIVVLGSNRLNIEERIKKVYEIYTQNPVPIICSGKHSIWQSKNEYEADIMKELLISFGIDRSQIITETQSLDTFGNAFFSLKKLQEHNLKKPLVISSPWHMNRVSYLFDLVFKKYDLDMPQYLACETSMTDQEVEMKSLEDVKGLGILREIVRRFYSKEVDQLEKEDMEKIVTRDLVGYAKEPRITLEDIQEIAKELR